MGKHANLAKLLAVTCIPILGILWWRGVLSSPRALTVPLLVLPLGCAMFALGMAQRRTVRLEDSRLGAFFRAPRGRLTVGVLGAAWMLAVMSLTTAGGQGSLLVGVFRHWPMAAMFLGFGLIGTGWARIGSTPYCAACGYDLSGITSRCPECGAALWARGAIVRGKRHVSTPWIVTGALLVALPFACLLFLFNPRAMVTWYLPLLPNDSLIAEVTAAPRGFTMDEWTELGKRALTPAQERRLAEGLVELRLRKPYGLRSEASDWLETYAFSGAMPVDLRERYYSEMADVALVAPARAGVGDQFATGIGSVDRSNFARGGLTQHALYLVTSGFEVQGASVVSPSDQPAPAGRSTEALTVAMLEARDSSFRKLLGGSERVPRGLGDQSPAIDLRADEPGQVRVRCSVWLFLCREIHGRQLIQWRDDGTPVLPPETAWARRIDLEAVVPIDPAPQP